jgi:hypothetical protein
MNKLYLTLAAGAVAAAVGVGAVVAYAHGSPQHAPTSKKQGLVNPSNPSGPTAAGTVGTYRPTAPAKPTVRPSNPQTAAGG